MNIRKMLLKNSIYRLKIKIFRKKTILNINIQFIGIIITTIINIFFLIALGRLFGPEQYGQFFFIQTMTTYFYPIQEGGLKTLIYRKFSSESNINCMHNFLSYSFGYTSFVTILYFVIYIALYKYTRHIFYLLLTSSIYFAFIAMTEYISSFFRGIEEYKNDAILQMASRFLLSIFCILFIIIHDSVLSSLIGCTIGAFIPLFYFFYKWNIFPKINIQVIRNDSKAMLCFILINLITTLYSKINIFIMKLFNINDGIIGNYAVAYKFYEGIILISSSISIVIFRNFCISYKNKQSLMPLCIKVCILMLFMSFSYFVFSLLYINKITIFIFGYEYKEAGTMAIHMAIPLFFSLQNMILIQAYIATNREILYMKIILLCSILNIIINFIFINFYGIYGSIYTIAITEFFMFIFFVIFINNIQYKNIKT